jgi:hypothetical protein
MPRIPRADAGTRTPDPFITSEVLYQLSYVGVRAPVYPRVGQAPAVTATPATPFGGRPEDVHYGCRARQFSARIAHRSWSRQRPPILRYRGENPSREKPAPRASAIDA